MNEVAERPKNKPTRPGKYYWRYIQSEKPGLWRGPLRITQQQIDDSADDPPDSHPLYRPDVEFGEPASPQGTLKNLKGLLEAADDVDGVEQWWERKLQRILNEWENK